MDGHVNRTNKMIISVSGWFVFIYVYLAAVCISLYFVSSKSGSKTVIVVWCHLNQGVKLLLLYGVF